MARLLRASCALLWVALCMGLPACAGAPVQEMSNARQAMNEAQSLLERAEISLQKRAYRDARRAAIAARGKASEALDAAQPRDRDGAG